MGHRGEGFQTSCFRARRLSNPLTCTASSPSSMNRPLLSLNEWFFVEIPPFFLDGEWSATSDGEPAVSFQPSRARKAQGLDGLSAKSKAVANRARVVSNTKFFFMAVPVSKVFIPTFVGVVVFSPALIPVVAFPSVVVFSVSDLPLPDPGNSVTSRKPAKNRDSDSLIEV